MGGTRSCISGVKNSDPLSETEGGPKEVISPLTWGVALVLEEGF